jgi:hypothetical protein
VPYREIIFLLKYQETVALVHLVERRLNATADTKNQKALNQCSVYMKTENIHDRVIVFRSKCEK